MPRKSRRKSYRLEVFQGRELLAWADYEVTSDGTNVDVYVLPDDLVRLAAYDLILLAAHNLCPFEREEAWIKARCLEHSRIDPDAYRAERERIDRSRSSPGDIIPF